MEPGSTVTSRVAGPSAQASRSPHRRVSPTLFGIILLCFLLPFVTVECGEPVTFTGVHAATGIDRPNAYNEHATPDGFALIALSSAGVGLLLGLLGGRKGALGGALAGFVGIVGLVGFIVAVTGQAYGHVVPRIGYLLSLYLFLGAVVLNDYLLSRSSMPGLAGGPVVRGSKRVYVDMLKIVAALLLLTLLGAEFARGGNFNVGHFEFEWYFLFFSLGVVLAICTGFGALIHAFGSRDHSGYV